MGLLRNNAGYRVLTSHRLELRKYIGPAVLVCVGTYMLNLSWFRWPDLLIDYGRELYVPWQLSKGKMLYADLFHLFGPLAQYVNALLFEMFGVGLSILVCFNLCLVALITFFIYDFFLAVFGYFIAAVAGALFLAIFAFSQYVGIGNYNFVCPYSHELTYGITVFFGTMFVFRRYLIKPGSVLAALMGFLVGSIFLTKVEVFLAAFIAILTGSIFIYLWHRPKQFLRHFMYFIILSLLPSVIFFLYFCTRMSFEDSFNAIFASYSNIFKKPIVNNIFYLRISGFDHPWQNFIRMCRPAGGYLVLMFFVFVVSILYARLSRRLFRNVWISLAFISVALAIILQGITINWGDIARPYPIFILLLFCALMTDLLRKRHDKEFTRKYLPFAVLVVFSFVLLLKMILNVHVYHYGFALAMPASMVMTAFLLHYIPEWLCRWGNRTIIVVFLGLFIGLAVLPYLNVTRQFYKMKNYPVGVGRDRFYTFDAQYSTRGPIVNATLTYLKGALLKYDTLAVFPEGVMLNYLSRTNNPTGYFEFTPHILDAMGERNILRSISEAQPSIVVLCDTDTSEYGARYFGKDYAPNLSKWIAENYVKAAQWGAEPFGGKGFGIAVAKSRTFDAEGETGSRP